MQPTIDEMILDYLVFTATRTILNDYERRGEKFDNADGEGRATMLLQMVACGRPDLVT